MPYLTEDPSVALLSNIDWQRHISTDEADGLAGISHHFRREAIDAREKGNDAQAAVLDLIAAAASLMLTEGAKPPFQPLIQIVGHGRSAALEDFGPHDVTALAMIAVSATNIVLRARLADVAATAGYELGIKEWKSGVLAAHAYLELSERHLLTEQRYDVLSAFRRGLQLGWIYCKNDAPLRDRYWVLLTRGIRDSLDHANIACALALVAEVIERRRDLGTQIAPHVEGYADQLAAAGDHDTAARCFAWAKKLWYAGGNVDQSKHCHLNEGHQLVARADGPGLAMVRAHWLAEGIEALRHARAPEAARSRWRYDGDHPLRAVQKPASHDERDRLISADEWELLEKSWGDCEPATIAALRWLRWTAARRGEAVALNWSDIDWSTAPPTAHLKNTKSRHDRPTQSRHIPLFPEAVAALRPLRGKSWPKDGPVFGGLKGDSLTRAWTRACERAKIANARVHDLRHTRITELAPALPLQVLARITGHREPSTLMRYYNPTGKDAATAGRAFANYQAAQAEAERKRAAQGKRRKSGSQASSPLP